MENYILREMIGNFDVQFFKGMIVYEKIGRNDVDIFVVVVLVDVFCMVDGRFFLFSSIIKYKVIIVEIQRRLFFFECLNVLLFGGVFRRVKFKNGGRCLREKLDKIGLSFFVGRRKVVQIILMIFLVEGEVVRLVRDYGYLCEFEFFVRKCVEYNCKKYQILDFQESMVRKNMVLVIK